MCASQWGGWTTLQCGCHAAHCPASHASPGFDGWVMLVREEFETEDQAIDSEKARLRSIGRVKRRRLEAGGVDVEQLQLTYECGLVYNPPDEDEERVWALEYFKERMLDYVADDDELLAPNQTALVDLPLAFAATVLRPQTKALPLLASLVDEIEARHAALTAGDTNVRQLTFSCAHAWLRVATRSGSGEEWT